jgi:hypothetical protein
MSERPLPRRWCPICARAKFHDVVWRAVRMREPLRCGKCRYYTRFRAQKVTV